MSFDHILPDAAAQPGSPCIDRRRRKARRPPLEVTGHVLALLGAGHGTTPDSDEVARLLGISRRTLVRRMHEEGTSFSALLDTARRREALRLLRDPALPINELSLRLGYVESSNFGRCFRRWFGVTPMAIRRGRAPWPAEAEQVAAA